MGDHREPSRTAAIVALVLAFLIPVILVFLYIDALARWWQ
jgi:hypothetical protein